MRGGNGVGEADQEAGAASGVQGVQGEGSETSEEMQVPGDWREEEQGCPAVLSRFACLMKELDSCVCSKQIRTVSNSFALSFADLSGSPLLSAWTPSSAAYTEAAWWDMSFSPSY